MDNTKPRKKYVTVVGISGISGSGKTTQVRSLADELKSTALYWDDYDEVSEQPSDYVQWFYDNGDFSAWKYPLLAQTLSILRSGRRAASPLNNQAIYPTPIIFFDAPLGYDHRETGKYIDYLVWIDIPLDIALARRILRDHLLLDQDFDTTNLRKELEHYCNHARQLYTVSPKTAPDLVLDGTQPLQKISQQIKLTIPLGNTQCLG